MYSNKPSSYRICSYIIWSLVIKLFTVSVECHNTNNSDVCTTPGCEAAAYFIKHNIDTTQDPCKNFYDYACGNFKESMKIPENHGVIRSYSLLGETILNNLTKALNENIDPNEPRIFKAVKNYYKACMDLGAINNAGLEPLSKIIDYLGGWPMVDYNKWDENNFNWIETVHKLRQLGYSSDYILIINAADKQDRPNNYLLEIREASTYLNADILKAELYDQQLQPYIKYMTDIAVLLGANVNTVYWEVINVINFERRLSKYVNNEYKIIKRIKDINKNVKYRDDIPVPEIPWLEYINNITFPIVNFKATDEVIVLNPTYLMDLPIILQEAGKRTVANYLIWRTIAESAPFLSTEIRALHDQFLGIIHNSRSESCLQYLLNTFIGMPVGTDALYIRKHMNNVNDIKEDVQNLMSYTLNQLFSHIDQLTWLDNKTKYIAYQKIQFMNYTIGFPDEIYKQITTDNSSFNLAINPNNHFQNVLNTRRFNFEQRLSSILHSNKFINDLFSGSHTVINAYYTYNLNRFVINAALLHSPIYSLDWPNYMNYGSLGYIISHEMMHAFDNAALTIFDPRWYTEQSFSEYRNKIQCFVEQYGNYYDESVNLTVNGILTLNENFADYGGTLLAYSGYKKWAEINGKELPLPGLNHTAEQTFWLSLANYRCSKYKPQMKTNLMLTEGHTIEHFRVFGIIQNSADFAKDFNCPVNSEMNPQNKCSLAK